MFNFAWFLLTCSLFLINKWYNQIVTWSKIHIAVFDWDFINHKLNNRQIIIPPLPFSIALLDIYSRNDFQFSSISYFHIPLLSQRYIFLKFLQKKKIGRRKKFYCKITLLLLVDLWNCPIISLYFLSFHVRIFCWCSLSFFISFSFFCSMNIQLTCFSFPFIDQVCPSLFIDVPPFHFYLSLLFFSTKKTKCLMFLTFLMFLTSLTFPTSPIFLTSPIFPMSPMFLTSLTLKKVFSIHFPSSSLITLLLSPKSYSKGGRAQARRKEAWA